MTALAAVVVLPVVLHARPAALVARTVEAYRSTVTLDGADAASVLALMRLGAEAGQAVRVEVSGDDAAEALDAVVGILGGELGPAPAAERHGTL